MGVRRTNVFSLSLKGGTVCRLGKSKDKSCIQESVRRTATQWCSEEKNTSFPEKGKKRGNTRASGDRAASQSSFAWKQAEFRKEKGACEAING